MQLTLLNCSPRGSYSNTQRIFTHFLDGYIKDPQNKCKLITLKNNPEKARRVIIESENIIIGFPLYTDAMPSILLELLWSLEPEINVLKGKNIGFIIHSGYPETHQSHYVERYLEKLLKKIGAEYSGSLIIGITESLRLKPPVTYIKLARKIVDVGELYGFCGKMYKKETKNSNNHNNKITSLNNKNYHTGVGLLNRFWDFQFKQSNTYEIRNYNPYIDLEGS